MFPARRGYRTPSAADRPVLVSASSSAALTRPCVSRVSYNPRMPNPPKTDHERALRVAFLGSGSSGNATAITDGETTVLVDCGFSAREVARRLRVHGIDTASVSAVLLTHEHVDHVRGIEVIARHWGCTVWATAGTLSAARLGHNLPDVRLLTAGEPARIGTLDVLAFRSSHDAAEPVGFVVGRDGSGRFGLLTDTGTFTHEAAEALRGCDVVALECNHDPDMLETGPYPWFLKKRIASDRGHLSNVAAADAIENLADSRLSHVFAVHLSRTNNTHGLARDALADRLARLGLDVKVTPVGQECAEPSKPRQEVAASAP